MISDAIVTRLAADGAVAALVSNRIYPVVAVQNAVQPFLVYTMGTDERQVMYPGSNSLVPGDLEISCYARSYKVVKNLAAAVRTCLVDFSGLMNANTSPLSSVRVSTIHLDGENDLEDIEPGLYRVLQRFTVWYYE